MIEKYKIDGLELLIKDNSATAEKIYNHFNHCDAAFLKGLSARVNLEEYSKKIAVKATTHEVWLNAELISLLAVYYDGDNENFSYISNISTTKKFIQKGLATFLLKKTIENSKKHGKNGLRLEVKTDNLVAKLFYKNFDFITQSIIDNNKSEIMLLAFDKEEDKP